MPLDEGRAPWSISDAGTSSDPGTAHNPATLADTGHAADDATAEEDAPDRPRPRARERLASVETTTSLLSSLHVHAWQLSGDELGQGAGALWRLRQVIEGQLVAVVQEAMTRGESGTNPREWLSAQIQATSSVPIDPGDIAAIVTVAESTRVDGPRTHPERSPLREAVVAGQVSPRRARICTEEIGRIRPLLQPGFVPAAWDLFTQLARTGTLPELRTFRPHLIARYGAHDALEKEHEHAHEHAVLFAPVHDGPLATYRLRLDPEQQAILEAAVNALSAPQPDPDGEPDIRPVVRRRAEALIEVLCRGVDGASSSPAAGTLLPVETIRRMCCDGLLLPAVLGARGELLDLGTAVRLFTMGQKRALLLRDRTCTFPGCDRPGTWADGHHLVHWADGGPTDLSNAALLCGLHHHVVHSRRMWGWVDDSGTVHWDLTPGRYDTELRTWRHQRRRPTADNGSRSPRRGVHHSTPSEDDQNSSSGGHAPPGRP